MTEMQKLDAALTEMGVEHTYDLEYMDGEQIIVLKNGKYHWDAICIPGSYGWGDGLLEVMGKPLVGDGKNVLGFLTADDVLKMLNGSEAHAKP
jgi:hypothetical protein